MSFFIRGKAGANIAAKKRKVEVKGPKGKRKKKPFGKQAKPRGGSLEDDVTSESGESDIDGHRQYNEHSSSDDEETEQETRLRLAKQYLEEIKREECDRADAIEVDRDAIRHRLKDEVLEQAGKLQRKLADELVQPDALEVRVLKGHQGPVTSIVISPDSNYIYSGSKDCSIIKWNVMQGRKMKMVQGGPQGVKGKSHSAHILSLAITSDSKFLASGCQKNIIHIWNPDTLDHIHTFPGHRDAVSGLAFRRGTHQLFSSSFDRSVKLWNLDEMSYIETLFGHQDIITAIDCHTQERAVTSGGRDNSVRIWNVVEESQLVFNGPSGSIDCVRLINEDHFFSGGDDGILAVYGTMKKKPLCSVPKAHGCSAKNDQPHWIASIAAMQNSDVLASGSNDGFIRIWKCGNHYRTLTPLFTVPVVGFVNSLMFANDTSFLVAGIGQEHRLGRWWRIKESRNSIVIVPLQQKR